LTQIREEAKLNDLALGHAEEEVEEMVTLRMAFAFVAAAADFEQLALGFGLTETKKWMRILKGKG
jgi:hypothetical protein